ncbi:hypothetical protein QO058_11225 [Bosea vestrisii]|uniref:hypothetical protein n=1 Tax=Bosea vestrisii TaxID=151416 RepID=UPI0024DF30F2|nr:hypothetical protein [Bosea vestrisii]WID98760.1 hypothetical protein QO058_11225 [Bosea vestrisii]
MTVLAGAGLFALQTAIMPLLCGVLMARLAGVPREDRTAFILYGLGLWSAGTALALDLALRFLPDLPRQAYLIAYAVAVAGVACGALWTRSRARPENTPPTSGLLRCLVTHWKSLSVYARIAIGIVTVICAFFLVQNLSEPLTGNDSIVHTLIARIISRDLSAAAYPLATADRITGFLLEGVHPLGFPASKAVFMILLGDLDTPWHKPLTAVYFIYLLLAVGTLSARLFGNAAAAFSMLIVACTPLLLHSVATAHIDPLRVHGFFFMFRFAGGVRQARRALVAAPWRARLRRSAAQPCRQSDAPRLPGSALSRCRARANLEAHPARRCPWPTSAGPGQPAIRRESAYLWLPARRRLCAGTAQSGTIPALDRDSTQPCEPAGHHLEWCPRPLGDLGWFAIGFWLGLVGIVFALAQGQHRHRPVLVLIGAVLIYTAIMCLAIAVRYKSFYMNTRYMLVMLPVLAVFGGYLFDMLLQRDATSLDSDDAGDQYRRSSPKAALVFAGFVIFPAFISLYQVLFPFARDGVVAFGLISAPNEPAIARLASLGLGLPLSLLALATWVVLGLKAAAWVRNNLPTALASPGAAKTRLDTDRSKDLQLFGWQFFVLLPIGIFLLPVLGRVYGAAEALGVRALVNASNGGVRSLVGLSVLCTIALIILWRWRAGRFPRWLRYPGTYPLLILCWLSALGYAFSLDLLLQASNLSPAKLQLAILTGVVLACLATFAAWLATRFVWRRRAVILTPVKAGSRRMLGYLLANQPTEAGYVTISYLFMPLLLANLYYGLGPLRSLIHPLYMRPSLIFQSDIAKAEATRGVSGGLEYLEPSLLLRDEVGAGKTPKTLTFRDAEVFAYGSGTIFSNYDPRIWDLYATKTAEQAHALLLQKGIDHLYMPNYSSPTNSFNGLGELLARRDMVRIAKQSDGSVFTLFEVAPEPGRITADVIYRGELSKPLLLKRAAFDLFPKSLGACAGLRDVHGDIFGWYRAQVISRLVRTSCLNAYADQNWIRLPPAKDGETYRLEADMVSVGCAGLRILHRMPPSQSGEDYTVANADFMHFALQPGEKAALWFQRPAGSDAIAVGFYGGCGQRGAISAFHVERLRELPR